MGLSVQINVKLKESAVIGKPVAFFDKYSRGSKDYYTLAKEIILLDKQADEVEESQEAESVPQQEETLPEETTPESVESLDQVKGTLQEAIDQAEAEEALKAAAQPFSEKMQKVVDKEAREFFTTRFAIEAPGGKICVCHREF